MVLGRIGGWTPPFQLSLTQIGVLLVSFYAMVKTWQFWAPALPSSLALIIGAGVPIGLTWAVRRVRVEGRSPAPGRARVAVAVVGPVEGPAAGPPPQGVPGGVAGRHAHERGRRP